MLSRSTAALLNLSGAARYVQRAARLIRTRGTENAARLTRLAEIEAELNEIERQERAELRARRQSQHRP